MPVEEIGNGCVDKLWVCHRPYVSKAVERHDLNLR